MNFDEWLEHQQIDPFANWKHPIKHYPILLKLVQAQGKMLEKLLDKLADQFPGTVIVLGPNSRKLMDEIERLEVALMGESQ